MGANGELTDLDKEYSHRCQNEACVSPSHGCWESHSDNIARLDCRGKSHIVMNCGRLALSPPIKFPSHP